MVDAKHRNPKYKLGDKVQLIVGGPEMAIKEVNPNYKPGALFYGTYRCQWFAGKKLDWGDFPEENLILVNEKSQESES